MAGQVVRLIALPREYHAFDYPVFPSSTIIKYPKEPKNEHRKEEVVPIMTDRGNEPVKKPHSFTLWNHSSGDKRFVVESVIGSIFLLIEHT